MSSDVIGAAIGVEFASLYNDLGSDVTLVEAEQRITPAEDADISALAEKAFVQAGLNNELRTVEPDPVL